MNVAILLAASLVGQYASYPYYVGSPPGYVGYPSFGSRTAYGYGFGGFPYSMISPMTNPIQYAELYEGLGYYNFPVAPIDSPKVIELGRKPPVPAITSLAEVTGDTGEVLSIDEQEHKIRVKLPTQTVNVPFGPQTIWASADGRFPQVKVGSIINIENNKITIIKR
jgi:hypothetical protein